MSNLIVKYLFKKHAPDLHLGRNPYFDTPEQTEARKFKEIPTSLSKQNAKILKSCRRKAYRLDESISCCCCCSARVGWSGIITFIPVVGDIISLLLSRQIISLAKTVDGGLPETVVAQMYANVLFDFGLALVPLLGDLAACIFKANTRNLQLLESYLLKQQGQGGSAGTAATRGVTTPGHAQPVVTGSAPGHQQSQGVMRQ